MTKLYKAVVILLGLVLTMTLVLPTHPASAFTLIGGKQSFYSPGVIAFKWGIGTDTETIWRQAFLSAAYDWDYEQNYVRWGNLASGTSNVMQTYSLYDPAEYGRARLALSDGIITAAFIELNTFSLSDKPWTFKISVASHEQGHGFGLNENNSVYWSVMNQNRDRLTIFSPQADDVAGIEYIYR